MRTRHSWIVVAVLGAVAGLASCASTPSVKAQRQAITACAAGPEMPACTTTSCEVKISVVDNVIYVSPETLHVTKDTAITWTLAPPYKFNRREGEGIGIKDGVEEDIDPPKASESVLRTGSITRAIKHTKGRKYQYHILFRDDSKPAKQYYCDPYVNSD